MSVQAMRAPARRDMRRPRPSPIRDALPVRIAATAAIAATHADEVDRESRFPHEALAAAKAHGLLSLLVPRRLGGEGAGLGEVADAAYGLGRACASAAMIFAMHQTKVACIVDHGGGHPWHDALLRDVADRQLLLASSTTEGQNGGNLRTSAAAVEVEDGAITLDRAATVISYGAEADGIVTTARRAADAAGSDQVLLVLRRSDYSLAALNGWQTLGMRGTCSSGFRLQARGSAEQVLPAPYGTIHAETMLPVSHLLWSSAWAGIAAGAVERAQAFTRKAARAAGGQLPPGAPHVGRAASSLRTLRALIATTLARYEELRAAGARSGSLEFQNAVTMLKVEASELAVATVMSALRATGLAGYRADGEFSLARSVRDILSSPIMIHNDRIAAGAATSALMAAVPATLRG